MSNCGNILKVFGIVFGVILGLFVFIIFIELLINGFGCNIQEYTHPGLYKNNISTKTIDKFYSFNNYPTFQEKVKEGLNVMKTKTVVICALARNIEKTFPKCMQKIESLGTDFKDYRILIFENDSSDKTREKLKQWNNPKVLILDCPEHKECKLNMAHPKTTSKDANMNDRMVKMAGLRNRYLDYVKEHFRDYDLAIVYDLDSRGGIYLDGFRSVFADEKKWNAVAARGTKPLLFFFGEVNFLYDAIAFVEKDKLPIKTKSEIVKHLLNYQKLLNKSKIDDELVSVESAFNGLCIYKMNSFLNSKYDSKTICEHVDFHKPIDKIFVSPALVLNNGIDTDTELPIKVIMNWIKS